MTLLQDLKNEIYRELNVETTAQVKELYPSYNLRRTSDWLELKAELVAKATETQTEPTELYGFPESETVLTGKTGELTEAFEIATDESTGENSDRASADVAEDDLEPDLIPPEPTDWAAIARTIQDFDRQAAQVKSKTDNDHVTFGLPSIDPEWVADEVPEPDAPMAPIPLALWTFILSHNLVADIPLSRWVH